MLAIALAASLSSYAQQLLTGTVMDAQQKQPLAGATVQLGSNTTSTDAAGHFSLPCNGQTTISISFVGYASKQQVIRDCKLSAVIYLQPTGSTDLGNVEVTATASNRKALLYQPAAIAKLGTQEINRGMGLFLDDAINTNVPGVSMNRRSVSAGQQFNIRGYGNGVRGTNGLSSNFDGQGYKVYLNGIPVTDAEGITLMDDIDFGSVGGVEVLKGPAGTLYGLAIAGVVNLKTVKAIPGQTLIGQDVQVGSNGQQRFTTRFSYATEHASLLLNYGYQHSDGYMLHTASTKRFANAIGHVELNRKQTIHYYAGYSDSYDQRGGELTLAQYANKDYSGNPDYIKRNAHSNVIGFRAGIGHQITFNKYVSNNTVVFGTGQSSNASSAGGWTDKTPLNYGLRSTFDVKLSLTDKIGLTGITGIETQAQIAQTIGYGMLQNPADANAYWIIGAMRSNQVTKSATTSLFTEWSLALPADWSVTAGIGHSNMRIELNDRFYVANSNKPTLYQRTYTGMWSPHVAINKVFSLQLSAYASYSKGYKAPVGSYFFIPTTGQVNTNLKPEAGTQWEIGSKGTLLRNRFTYQLALFATSFSNKMTAIAVPLNAGTTAYSYIANGGEQLHKGVEVTLHYAALQSKEGFVRLLRPFANATLADYKYKNYKFQRLNANSTAVVETDFSGKAVAGVPRFTANAGVDLQTSAGIYANMVYAYKDGAPITSDGLNSTSAYALLNAKIGWQKNWGKHWQTDVYAGANNITGVQYPIMVFVNQLPDAYVPAPLHTQFFGGLQLQYIF